MKKLDSFSLDLEFLLISVVQGVALAALATAASGTVGDLKFEYFPYVISSFFLILNFWSEAVIHAVSFIDWPIDLSHSFLYFLASFIEVMAFSHVENPIVWFAFISVFFVVAMILYLVDLSMVRARKNKFKGLAKQKLYKHILSRQLFEMKYFLPAAIIFAAVSFGLLFYFPDIFITHHWHVALIWAQTLFGVVVLLESIQSFKKRVVLVSATRK